MSSDIMNYLGAVEVIKTAILQAQYAAAKSANAQQLQLYFAVGGYVSANTRNGAWGSRALKSISEQLQRELPGLRGFSEANLKYMRLFFEAWSNLDDGRLFLDSSLASDESSHGSLMDICHLQVPKSGICSPADFLSIGFTHHRYILAGAKAVDERLFYIHKCATEHLSVEALKRSLKADDFHHQGEVSHNFLSTLPKSQQALCAIATLTVWWRSNSKTAPSNRRILVSSPAIYVSWTTLSVASMRIPP